MPCIKDRTPRNEVMDAVYDDFDFAMKNVRLDDGDAQYVNRYVVAAFVSRWALFEQVGKNIIIRMMNVRRNFLSRLLLRLTW